MKLGGKECPCSKRNILRFHCFSRDKNTKQIKQHMADISLGPTKPGLLLYFYTQNTNVVARFRGKNNILCLMLRLAKNCRFENFMF